MNIRIDKVIRYTGFSARKVYSLVLSAEALYILPAIPNLKKQGGLGGFFVVLALNFAGRLATLFQNGRKTSLGNWRI
jgi:hypothetical protein